MMETAEIHVSETFQNEFTQWFSVQFVSSKSMKRTKYDNLSAPRFNLGNEGRLRHFSVSMVKPSSPFFNEITHTFHVVQNLRQHSIAYILVSV